MQIFRLIGEKKSAWKIRQEMQVYCLNEDCDDVLCGWQRSVDSLILLDPRSRCFGWETTLPRRYSGSKIDTP